MKYILTLSLKYVKRQKFRTVLTFIGLMLASFIMGLSMFGASSVYESVKNYVFDEYGRWEVMINGINQKSGDTGEVVKKLEKNLLVEDLYYYDEYRLGIGNFASEADEKNCFEITVNGETVHRAILLEQFKVFGDKSVMGNFNWVDSDGVKSENGIVLPAYMKASGLKTGDEINLEITPVSDGTRGKAVSGSFTVEGFSIVNSDVFFNFTVSENRIFAEELSTANGDIFRNSYSDATAVFRINGNADFDDALNSLLEELFNGKYTYSDLVYDEGLNSTVLMMELRTLVKVGDFVISISMIFAFIFLVWLIARFIIDNTFEISVAERNRKFNLLRTLGASKGQLAALTVFEAVFYCATAVTSGVLISYFAVKLIFESFRNSGINQAVFSVYPVVFLMVFVLCIVSVFISSYTSALWPTRKMTLVNAMNYGVTGKISKKKNRIRKNRKLHKSPNGFIWMYTKRNIGRTKGKFIFSAAAGSVSAIMLVAVIMTSATMKDSDTQVNEKDLIVTDYFYSEIKDIRYSEIKEYFTGDFFASVRYQGRDSFIRHEKGSAGYKARYIDSETADAVDRISGRQMSEYQFGVISEDYYNIRCDKAFGIFNGYDKHYKSLADYSGLSYEKFRDSGESILVVTGNTGNQFRKMSKPVSLTSGGYDYRVSGVCYIKDESGIEGFETAFIVTAAENASDISFSDGSLQLEFAGTEVHEKCTEMCENFRSEYGVRFYANNYADGTGRKGFMKSVQITVLIFFIFLWLTGIVSVINLTNTRIMNSQREYFIMRCSGMTVKMLIKCVLQEVIIFSAVSTVSGLVLGVAFYLSFMGGVSAIQESFTGVGPAEALKEILKVTAAPLLSSSLLYFATGIAVPVAFAYPMIKKLFETSPEIVNSNDLR